MRIPRTAPAEGVPSGWIVRLRWALILLAFGILFDRLVKPLGGSVAWLDVTRR